jgi:hypothetical protein
MCEVAGGRVGLVPMLTCHFSVRIIPVQVGHVHLEHLHLLLVNGRRNMSKLFLYALFVN